MKNFLKKYGFMILMILGIVAGCVVGMIFPEITEGENATKGAKILAPLGTLYINMMFCVVVPMVFCSISSAVANMSNAKKAGKVMGVTVATFFVTATIAAVIMYLIARFIPLVSGEYNPVAGDVDEPMALGDMIVAFFTKPDFSELLSRRAILPLLIFAVLFGFGVQLSGGIYMAPSQFEAIFVSDAHSEEDVARTLEVFGHA